MSSPELDDIEVIEIVTGGVVELAHEDQDPLAGATVTGITVGAGEPDPELGQSYAHQQATPAAIWLVLHPLPFVPAAIRVVGTGGQRLYPQRETYPAAGRVRLDFTRPVAGTAYLS